MANGRVSEIDKKAFKCRLHCFFFVVLFLIIGRPCFPIYKPVNGMKNCSGYRTEDSCNFDCLPGYGLSGSMERTCGPDKQWTGNMTECKSKLR